MQQISSILLSTLNMSIPLILAALGGVMSVRGGIMALGLESMMMSGAFCAAAGSYATGNAYIGVLCGMLGGLILGLLHGVLSVRYKVNQVISGIGLNMLLLAATTLLMQQLWNNKGASPQVASLESGVLTSPIFFLALFAIAALWFVIYRTKFGLHQKMTGENPKAAATMGIPVRKIKYISVGICGILAGLGGSYLSIAHLNMFVRDMTAGRGYIAVAITILGRYDPVKAAGCALIFGFCDAIQISLQGYGFAPQLIANIPYVVTLLVLAFGVQHIVPPAGVGKYEDE